MALRSFTHLCRSVVCKGGLGSTWSRLMQQRGLHGIFINYVGQERPYFFSRPAPLGGPHIHAKLSLPPPVRWGEVVHHCNGLLLVVDRELFTQSMLYVCNPATRRWAELPPRPGGRGTEHLVFNPADSLHYHVLFFPDPPPMPEIPGMKRPWEMPLRNYCRREIESLTLDARETYEHEARSLGSTEWPPSSYMAQVYSSRTGRWEEKTFDREDDMAITVSDVWSDPWGPHSEELSYYSPRCNAEYWQGAFYIHCHGGFVIRLSLLEHKYRVIKTPMLDDVFTRPPRLDFDDYFKRQGPNADKEISLQYFQSKQESWDNLKPTVHLGKSKHGVYYTAIRWFQLRVWVLHEASESRPTPEWELKHEVDIEASFMQHYKREARREEIDQPWTLDPGEERSDATWDSSDDDCTVTDVEEENHRDDDDVHHHMQLRIDLLGYHPDKEIVFLGNHFDGFAYYLGSSKLQYLGTFSPEGCVHYMVAATHEAFVYTPWMDDLFPVQEKKVEHEVEESDDNEHCGDEDEDLEEEAQVNDKDSMETEASSKENGAEDKNKHEDND